MTERERLIELLRGRQAYGKTAFSIYPISNEEIADYLLANGVIVPLCKVGDVVYQTDGIRIYELDIFDIYFHKNKLYYESESIAFDSDAIGKRIFLTKEEAEQALKGGTE